jgi:23S rRNA (pseudouridine1915-N3)-methyltransferase
MLLHLVAAGTRLPGWVNAGYRQYAERLQGADFRMALTEIVLGRRTGDDVTHAVATEGERMLAAAGSGAHIVALQVNGESWSTARLARWLDECSRLGDPLAFCIGGPDGLAAAVDARARLRWSLSPLTLPHGLARVVTAEALYRAVALIKGLPYHRI